MTLLFSSAAWSWCEVYWGVNMSGVFGGKCADLAPYAPPGWLCRDHKNGGGIAHDEIPLPSEIQILFAAIKDMLVDQLAG